MANPQHKRTRTDWGFGGLNIRSLLAYNKPDKINAVRGLIVSQKLDILVIGESLLKNHQHADLQINDFSYVRFDRINQERAAGGLIIYIRTGIQFRVTSINQCPNTNLQYVKLAITCPFRFDLVAIYSPPNDLAKLQVQTFMDLLLKRSKDGDIPVMFIGDLNIARDRGDPVPILRHLGLDHGRTVAALFERFEDYYHAEALITAPTCGIDSCIDHIITNIHTVPEGTDVAVIGSGVEQIHWTISDHNLIWCRVNGNSISSSQQQNSYLLRLHDDRWEQTEIDNDGNQVGKSIDLSQNVQSSDKIIRKTILCMAKSCHDMSETRDEMKQHVHENHFPCTVCVKVLKSKYYGPDHMERKHGIYMCRDVHCNGLRFNDSQERGDHENDGNHLVCKECKPENRRAFSRKPAYKKHQKSHRQQPKIMKGFMVK